MRKISCGFVRMVIMQGIIMIIGRIYQIRVLNLVKNHLGLQMKTRLVNPLLNQSIDQLFLKL